MDIGQIEGAFVQGLGYYLTEHVLYDDQGRLTTNGTWEYKPMGVRDIPLEFNVTLIPPSPPPGAATAAASHGAKKKEGGKESSSSAAASSPAGKGLVLSSKATGEPPYMLASSAYFGLIKAIREGRQEWREGGKEGEEEEEIGLAIPATIEERVKAVDVPVEAFVLT